MMTPVPPIECVRARESASELLDDELPELDATRLDWHLRNCGECRAYAAQLKALAVTVRTAPAQQPELSVRVPARRRRPAIRLQTAAAAVILVGIASASSFALGSALGTGGSSPARTSTAAGTQDPQASSAQQHLLALLGPQAFGGFVNTVPHTSGFRPV
jgi:predicted anti-sigma-YlaC factor YlaD